MVLRTKKSRIIATLAGAGLIALSVGATSYQKGVENERELIRGEIIRALNNEVTPKELRDRLRQGYEIPKATLDRLRQGYEIPKELRDRLRHGR